MRFVSRYVGTIAQVVVAASLVAATSLAYAHAHPKIRTPAADTTVAEPPHEVTIEFDEALEPAFSSITVTDAHGNAVSTGKSVVDAHDRRRMAAAVGTLAPGAYTVAWVAVAADGHRTEGRYAFNVK